MKTTRFDRAAQNDAEGPILEYRAREASGAPEPGMTTVDELSLSELAGLAGLPDAGPFQSLDSAFILGNGWQSWSPGWELGPGETMERARLLRRLNVFTDHPALIPARGEILASFLSYIRVGEDYLALASVPSGTPPVSFLFRRKKNSVALLVYAEGARFAAGEPVARIRLIRRKGYFELKDALRRAYAPYRLFERLAFLGRPGEPLVPGGYESWYNHYADINKGLLLADLDNLAGNGNLIDSLYIQRGKPAVFQVDDGWEGCVGDWHADKKRFPRGMGEVARRVEAAGLIPGLWLAPFIVTRFAPLYAERPEWLLRDAKGRPVRAGWIPNWGYDFFCLDLSLPEVRDYLFGIFDRVVNEWGFRYLKLDFLYAGLLRGVRRGGGTAWSGYRDTLKLLTSVTRRGDDKPVAFLGCGAPFEASFEFLPLMRIGADTREEWDYPQLKFLRHSGRPSAWINMKNTIGRALWDGTVFLSDPDVIFCRRHRMRLSESEMELVALVSRMFASQVMFSDDAADFDPCDEGALTQRIVDLYGRIEGGEFRPERVPGQRDVYTARSRDGRMSAVLNLSDRDAAVAGTWPAEQALIARFSTVGGGMIFHRHSISLFDTMAAV